jgi:hypothetical protein
MEESSFARSFSSPIQYRRWETAKLAQEEPEGISEQLRVIWSLNPGALTLSLLAAVTKLCRSSSPTRLAA